MTTLIFDGYCGFCTRAIRALERLDRNKHLRFQAWQTPGTLEAFELDQVDKPPGWSPQTGDGITVQRRLLVRSPWRFKCRGWCGFLTYHQWLGRRILSTPGSRGIVIACVVCKHIACNKDQIAPTVWVLVVCHQS
jgi:DCC1-like thiol-disulfide oxidoreductase